MIHPNKQLPFWLLTASVLIVLILPTLLQDGMFMDGLLYACVSKNLADGIGSFWFPHFSKTMLSFFDQQPPLGFGIQSLFYKIFGSSIYVERGYSFLTALITAALIVILWRMIFKDENEIKKLGWLPVLFWITIPVCFWAYSNNMLENTMGIFDMFAVIFIFRFLQSPSFLLVIISGIFIFIASLTKGIQGMFPLVALFAGGAVYRSISPRKMFFSSLLLMLVPFSIYFSLLQNDMVFQSISAYLHNRVLNSIQNVGEGENRFYLILRLCLELLPIAALSIIIYILKRIRKEVNVSIPFFKKHILFFLLIGISASFPLIITREQRGFYLVTSFPYFAISIAVISAPYLSMLIEKINCQYFSFKISRIVSILLLVSALTFSFLQIGKTSRDKVALHDIYLIGEKIPKGTIVGANYELWRQWSFQEYLVRHFYISLDNKITPEHDYVILESEINMPDSIIAIEKVNIPTIKYHLYKAQKSKIFKK